MLLYNKINNMTKLKTRILLAFTLVFFLFAALTFTGCNSEGEKSTTTEPAAMDDADSKPIKTGAKGDSTVTGEPVKMDTADTKPIKTGP